jgi:hypothetical protein
MTIKKNAMKRFSYLACLLMTSAAFTRAADTSAEEKIKVIRAHYSEIEESLKQCRQVKRDLPGESAEGGELIGYFKDSSLRKIAATFYGETGKALVEYYFWDGRLFFVLRAESRYTTPMSGRVKSKTEERFYFAGGKLIQSLGADKKPGALSEQAEQRSRELLAQAGKYSTLINREKE